MRARPEEETMQRLKILTLSLAACFVALCLPDTALGQNELRITDSSSNTVASTATMPAGTLTFTASPGQSVNQTLTASLLTGGAAGSGTISYTVQNDSTTGLPPVWLRVNGTAGG